MQQTDFQKITEEDFIDQRDKTAAQIFDKAWTSLNDQQRLQVLAQMA